jgi:DNA-binding MarR family transcriptional regulator
MTSTKIPVLNKGETARRLAEELPRLIPNLKWEAINMGAKLRGEGRSYRELDIIAKVRSGSLSKTIVFEVKSIGEPRMAEQTITQLRLETRALPNAYLAFGAPYISERSREICKSEGIGYVDLVGNAYLQFGPVLIDCVSGDCKVIDRRELKSIFSPKATRVVRALLQAPSERARITKLAKDCSMSPAGVYFVVQSLDLKGFVTRGDDRTIILSEPRRLLLEWAKNWSVEKSQVVRYFSFEKGPERLISQISQAAKRLNVDYAFTGMAGASMVAPFTRYDDVWFYAKGDTQKLVKELDLRPVSSGANVVVLDPYDEGVFYGVRNLRGAQVVSNIQLFVDLYTYPARGQEQAEELLKKMPDFREAK